jgi:hypothetical protein
LPRGKTVIFATRYLEEADAYADRAVLMAHGRVVADGPTTEIRARVGRRTIRATLGAAKLEPLAWLPGAAEVDRRGDVLVLRPSDSDAAIRALLEAHPSARDIEIATAGLEEAFLERHRARLTQASPPPPARGGRRAARADAVRAVAAIVTGGSSLAGSSPLLPCGPTTTGTGGPDGHEQERSRSCGQAPCGA